jgi:hypothetical protein
LCAACDSGEVTPPAAVAVLAALGLWTYGRAWRKGLTKSLCLLRDVRLVLGYLTLAFGLGIAFTVREIV